MEFDLTPKFAQKVFEGDGGAYYIWSSSEFPLLQEGKVGAGSDGIVGMVFPNTPKEVVLKLKKGDVMPVPVGAVSWWFNQGDSELVVVFLGETSKSYSPGQFSYFFLSGAQGIMAGFSPEFVSRAYNTSIDDANKLAKSQTGVLIVKLQGGTSMPKPDEDNTNRMVYNIDDRSPDIVVKNGGQFTILTEEKFPFIIGQLELSANLVKLDAKAMYSPVYIADAAVQVIYVVKGGGQIQIVGLDGKRVLDVEVKPGHLLVVPRLFVEARLAGGDGLECFSMITSKQPVLKELAGKASVWDALSPAVLEASLHVSAELGELLKSNMGKTAILVPPPN
ncbi:11S globulin seed storage protein 2 [Morella rubra]|uniref:11S globulin seed storage protein 2 n=1 Tax=Morella rubra TaxID=262757 RepID=A0A6A1VKB0_9ROSI|nr:11S globulin seed storage protein 2 [Morella rubra]